MSYVENSYAWDNGYDQGQDALRTYLDVDVQDFGIIEEAAGPITHGVGGTWRVAALGPADPQDGTAAADNFDVDAKAILDAVSAYAQVEIVYLFSQDTPPTGYDILLPTPQMVGTDVAAWGSLALLSTPVVHNRPGNWPAAELASGATVTSGETNINAQTNAAFEIAGAPGSVVYGDGGSVNTYSFPAGGVIAGHIPVGTIVSNGNISIAAIPTGTTFDDSNVSTVKHVMFGTDIRDNNANATIVIKALGDALLWTRAV